jgi:hypothetical protein
MAASVTDRVAMWGRCFDLSFTRISITKAKVIAACLLQQRRPRLVNAKSWILSWLPAARNGFRS